MTQECIIVGAGISGLVVARRLLQHDSSLSITIMESDTEAGGRIRTQDTKGFHVEKGAGRVAESHRQLLALIEEMCLTEYLMELPKEREFVYQGKRMSYDIHKKLAYVIKASESYKGLSEITLFQLCVDTLPGGYDEACIMRACFGFDAEFMKMSALACLSMCKHDLLQDITYYVLTCGFSELIRRLVASLEAQGVTFMYETTVTDIKHRRVTYQEAGQDIDKMAAMKIVCTIPYQGLRKLELFRDEPWIKSIKPISLHRLYVKYDTPWFANMRKITTDNYVRYIIPIREDECTVMYYTDSQNADLWNRWCHISNDKAVEMIHRELHHILSPSYKKSLQKAKVVDTKSCYWEAGVHMWRPGSNFKKVSKQAIEPFDDIFVCGEGYSLYQDWIEGSLDTARLVCEKITGTTIRKPYKNNKRTRKK